MKNFVFTMLIALFSLLIVSCFQEPDFLEEKFEPGRNYIRIQIGNLNRSILPGTTDGDFLSYSIVFHTPGTTDNYLVVPLRPKANLSDPIYIDAGTYNLVLTAYTDAAGTKPAAIARQPITISATPQTHTITLTAIKNSTPAQNGTFKWEIKFPPDFFTNGGEAIMEISGVTPTIDLKTSSVANAVNVVNTGSQALPSGTYNVIFHLKKDAGTPLPVVWHEVLTVYQHMESTFDFEFKDDHFTNDTYNIYYHLNYENIVLDQSYIYNAPTVKPTTDPVRQTPSSLLFEGTPPAPPSGGFAFKFKGWFDIALQNEFVFGGNITTDIHLYAKWENDFIDVSGRSETGDFEKAIGYVKINVSAVPAGYTLLVCGNEDTVNNVNYINCSPITLNSNNPLVIKGEGLGTEIRLSSNGILFNIYGSTNAAAKEIILDNITLVGRSANNSPVVSVQYGANLLMRNNSKITGNTVQAAANAAGYGSAVYVTDSGSVFTMVNSGITGNKASGTSITNGNTPNPAEIETNINAGLYVESGAKVFLNGGSVISGNKVCTAANLAAGIGDEKNVFISDNAGQITLSGNAETENIVLNATSASSHPTLTIASGWNGKVPDLCLRANTGDTSVASGFWVNSKIFDGAGFNPANVVFTPSSTAGRIALGNFISPLSGNAAAADQPSYNPYAKITNPPYQINNNGELVYNSTDVTVTKNSVTTRFPDLRAALVSITTEGVYTVTIDPAVNILPPVNNNNTGGNYISTSGIKIKLESSDSTEKIINLSANGMLFDINGFNTELTLGSNITLNGRAANNNTVVRVQNGAVFIMETDSKITGNTSSNSTSGGAAVYVYNSGVFRMNGGTITGNTSTVSVSSGESTYPAGGLFAAAASNAYETAVYLEGGSITGNNHSTTAVTPVITPRDVFIAQTADVFSLAESSEIGTLVMNYSNVNFAPITVVSSWSGSVDNLSLRGTNLSNSPSTTVTNVMTFWGNNRILKKAENNPSFVIDQTVVDKFTTLGSFIASGGNLQGIEITHYLDSSGWLRAKSSFKFTLPSFSIDSPKIEPSGLTLYQSAKTLAEFKIINPEIYKSIKWYYGTTPITTVGGDDDEILNLAVEGKYNSLTSPYDRVGWHTITAQVITHSGALHTKEITFEVKP